MWDIHVQKQVTKKKVSSETVHHNNVVVDRGTRDDFSAEDKGVIGK